MKKIICLLIICSIFLVGCKNDNNNYNDNDNDNDICYDYNCPSKLLGAIRFCHEEFETCFCDFEFINDTFTNFTNCTWINI